MILTIVRKFRIGKGVLVRILQAKSSSTSTSNRRGEVGAGNYIRAAIALQGILDVGSGINAHRYGTAHSDEEYIPALLG